MPSSEPILTRQSQIVILILTLTLNPVIFCDKSAAGNRRFCDLPTTENDVLSEKET